jgi:drug/metabolite transporter (DMT)-like permease
VQGQSKLRLSAFLVFMGGASYGIVSPLVKYAYQHGYSSADMTVAQFYYAVVILWALVAVSYRASRQQFAMTWKNFGKLVWLGVVGTLTSLFYYKALTMLPAWLGVILLFQFAWITFLIQYIMTRKRPHRVEWFGIVFVVIGTILANIGGIHHQAHMTWLGVLLGLLSAVTYSLFLYFNAGIDTSSPPLYRSAIIATVSAVAITFVFPPHADFFLHNWQGLWVYGIMVGLFSQAIPTTLFAIGIPKLGGGAAAILSSVELPVAVLLSAWWLGESVMWIGWLGVVLIFAGIIVGVPQKKREKHRV